MDIFSLLVGLGAGLGLVQVFLRSQPENRALNLGAALGVLLMALLGARLAFVLVYAPVFAADPSQAWMFWRGGLSWPGALGGGLLAVLLLALGLRQPLARAVDAWLLPLLAPLAVMTWLAAWAVGVAYGASLPADSFWAVRSLPDGEWRWPLQLSAALLCWLLPGLEERSPLCAGPGQRSAMVLFALGWVQLIFSVLRFDPRPLWHGLFWDVWAALALLLVSLLLGVLAFWLPVLRARRVPVSVVEEE